MYDEETGFFYYVQINEDGSEKKLLVNRGDVYKRQTIRSLIVSYFIPFAYKLF